MDVQNLIQQFNEGGKKALARCITIVENELKGHEQILTTLQPKNIPVIGITGPPGAGKSTLINAVVNYLTKQNKKVGILAIDPTSPFNYGSLLGDRLRMADHFTNENVFIRSLATRGALGGLSAKTIEICDVMRSFDFDYVFVETVGVGQSEVEIVGLADITVLVLVPEAGDEVQTLKSGIMEIADVYVVNKADRDGANTFLSNLHHLVSSRIHQQSVPPLGGPQGGAPIIKCIATRDEGVKELVDAIDTIHPAKSNSKKIHLLTEKVFHLIQNQRMKNVNKEKLHKLIDEEIKKGNFNLYTFAKKLSH